MVSERSLVMPSANRKPGLDALRASATILVVLLHAGIPFTIAPLPGLTWPVRHTATSSVVDVVFWSIEGMIMPLFFMLSGYGAAQSLMNKPDLFVASRWRRLGKPLLAAATVILPLELYVWLIGWALDGQLPWRKLQSLKFGTYHDDLWGLSHLWYLEYLLLYSMMLWAVSRWPRFAQSPPSATAGRLLASRAILCVMILCTLWLAPEVIVGFQHGFLPSPAKFIYSGLFFAAGVLEFRQPSRLLIRPAGVLAACGILFALLIPLIHRQVASPLSGWDKGLLVLGLFAYATLTTRAIWDWASSARREAPPLVKYLATASFWIYLVHHPLVAIEQIALRSTGLSALTQFSLVTVGTLAISLGSYELFVRRTWLGAFLEGRVAVPVISTTPTTPTELPVRRAA